MHNFIRKYSLSKTLRFELRPVGETAEKLADFKNQGLANIVEQDRRRAQDYKAIKKIIDDYHRYFIDNALSQEIFTSNEIVEAFVAYSEASGQSKEAKKQYETIQKVLRKKIAKVFDDEQKKYFLFDAKLFNEKGSGDKKVMPLLWQWLKDRLDKGQIKKDDFQEAEKLIKAFDKFSTYFTGFNQNRRNIYSQEEQSTAISYRIVHDNMSRHFDNCIRMERIKQNYHDLAEVLERYESVFKPPYLSLCLRQTAIDKYNEVIGHRSDDINAKGVNQIINEYRQKNNIKSRKLPVMSQMYKQILSDRENGFILDEFTDDKSVFDAISALYNNFKSDGLFFAAKDCLSKYLTYENSDLIYIKNDISLTGISQKLWGDWGLISRALERYVDDETKKSKEQWLNRKYYSIREVQTAIEAYFENIEKPEENKSLTEYFTEFKPEGIDLIERIEKSYSDVSPLLSLTELSKSRQAKGIDGKPGEGFLQIEKIKVFLDSVMDFQHFLKPLYIIKSGRMIELAQCNSDFYEEFNSVFDKLSSAIGLYSKVRNYITKKPYKTDKFKINFENSTLLDGWDVNKETDNTSVLFFKGGHYYLGIMNKNAKTLFNYRIEPEDPDAKKQIKKESEKQIVADVTDDYYNKMVYKLLPDPAKMLPKVFFSKKNISFYSPSEEILDIRENGLFKKEAQNPEAMKKWINFLKVSLKKHPEWGSYFDFKFSDTSEYADSSHFYREVAEQGYHLTFDKIKSSYIDEKVASGELYLFEIYSKDFSPHSKGRPNLHTSYWKLLFEKENLKDLVLKLNGQAEVFFRPASLKKKDVPVHNANHPIENKNPLNQKRNSKFEYDIVKDRRFTRDKFFFHCPITLNFKEGNSGRFNEIVNSYLKNNPEVNLIGVDRGERHLLYYTVTDRKGCILEQGSLNRITNSMTSDGMNVKKTTDYHRLLNTKEKERDAARKSWSSIENIKELKGGYLSHIVHKLATMMVKHNAVLVLEDLNFGFKRGRFKVEKQIYQKFEKALIDKLNYLVFKDRLPEQSGYYLSAYQLTAPFVSFQKLGKQSGFLFYVTSNYTSKIDPVTGFVNLLPVKYESIDKSRSFFGRFDNICYDPASDYFKFSFNYTKFHDRAGEKSNWIVCTCGKERYRYCKETREYKCYDVTSELKTLFDRCQIDFANGENLIELITSFSISRKEDATFYRSLMFLFSLTVQLRHTFKDGTQEKDFILSPVANAEGNFFDSRKYDENGKLPANADANGAYNIARKGIITLEQINKTDNPATISNKQWFDFVQKM